MVTSGYVIPSRLEIKALDLDGVSEKEVILNYNEGSYLFKVDSTGAPYLVPYEVEDLGKKIIELK